VSARAWAALVAARLRSDFERENLRAAVRQLETAGASAVWVLSHDGELAREALGPCSSRVAILALPTRRAAIERARLVNHAATRCEAELLWIHDPCFEMPFADVAAAIASSDDLAIQPFDACRRLDRDASRRFRAGETGTEPARAVGFGKGSFLIDRALFLAMGGLSEAFVGAGEEGVELGLRCRHLGISPVRLPFTACELWSGSGREDAAERRNNKDLGARLATALAADPDRYLSERLESSLPVNRAELDKAVIGRRRALAFRATAPHPPKQMPTALPGSIWGVTAIFNPAGYHSKPQNFERFRARLRRDGLPLLAVELAFGDAPFELEDDSAEQVLRLRGGDVLWQKERLLNEAIRSLPAECDKVVWLDADVLFDDAGWVAKTASSLEHFVVVQPFSRSARLLAGESSIDVDTLAIGSGEHQVLHGMAYGVAAKGLGSLRRYLVHGHSGYAWAARRSVLERHGLYDANVLGNGDLNIAHAMFGGSRYLKTERMSERAANHLRRWADSFFEDVQGSVGFVEGAVYHLWHGKMADRRYIDRLDVLIEHDFDPALDLSNEAGAYRWASTKPALHAVCREYFTRRREDD
jgi:hypothetical protein